LSSLKKSGKPPNPAVGEQFFVVVVKYLESIFLPSDSFDLIRPKASYIPQFRKIVQKQLLSKFKKFIEVQFLTD
jgi:hypothetical protein